MKHYNPLDAPDPDEWLSMAEHGRIALVREHHRRARIRLPDQKAHAVVHTIVENQVALGDEIPVKRTLHRLMAEGLDRHEAIHAIGMVLVEFIHDLLNRPDTAQALRQPDPTPPYYAALETLTAEAWRQSG